jgi:spore cortex biosynthesis protein YabQ
MTLQEQFLTIGLMFGCGLALGVVFDTYRVLTGQLRLPRWLISLADIFYWIGATGFVFRTLFYSNQGQIRMFVFIGLVAGVSFHYCFTSHTTIRMVRLLIRVAKWSYHLLLKLISILIVKPILVLYRLLWILLGILWAITLFLYKLVIQLLYPFWRMFRFFARLFGRLVRWPVWGGWFWRKVCRQYDKISPWLQRLRRKGP